MDEDTDAGGAAPGAGPGPDDTPPDDMDVWFHEERDDDLV